MAGQLLRYNSDFSLQVLLLKLRCTRLIVGHFEESPLYSFKVERRIISRYKQVPPRSTRSPCLLSIHLMSNKLLKTELGSGCWRHNVACGRSTADRRRVPAASLAALPREIDMLTDGSTRVCSDA